MVPLASHALCDSHTSKASNTKDAILQAEPPDNALARVPTAFILELGVGQVTHPSLKMGNQYHHGNTPSSPSTSKRDCNGDASLSSSGSTDTVAT